MHYLNILIGFLIIAAALAIGEGLKIFWTLPTPAPVIGIVILVAVQYILPDRIRTGLYSVADFLLRHMVLFFIPALMLLLEQGALLKEYGLIIFALIIFSTMISLPLMALLFMHLNKQEKKQ